MPAPAHRLAPAGSAYRADAENPPPDPVPGPRKACLWPSGQSQAGGDDLPDFRGDAVFVAIGIDHDATLGVLPGDLQKGFARAPVKGNVEFLEPQFLARPRRGPL